MIGTRLLSLAFVGCLAAMFTSAPALAGHHHHKHKHHKHKHHQHHHHHGGFNSWGYDGRPVHRSARFDERRYHHGGWHDGLRGYALYASPARAGYAPGCRTTRHVSLTPWGSAQLITKRVCPLS